MKNKQTSIDLSQIGYTEKPNGGGYKPLNNNNIIKNISYSQSEILLNIMELYNDNKPFDCDMTASKLQFYRIEDGGYAVPPPKLLFDVCPQESFVKKIDKDGLLPLEDNSIGSIVCDLPFVISPMDAPSKDTDGANIIMNRFASYYPVIELYKSYFHWIKEMYRVLSFGGICVFKCQDVVSGGIRINAEGFSFMSAMSVGFTIEDRFTLEAKTRLIAASKIKRQQHSRSYTSQIFVFKKYEQKRKNDYNFFELINQLSKVENGNA